MQDRKHYIDNLRVLAVLMLFPYHTFMIYNNWGENWYLHGKDLFIPSILNQINYIWMMPLLFAVAGISSRYALEKRSAGEYAKERTYKLLIPLLFGGLLLIPIQSYIAGVYFNQSANYLNFFTKLTDFSGYDGAFTPGQLWFILFLFVISIVCLPFMAWYKKKGKGNYGAGTPMLALVLLGILPCIGSWVKIGGKSPTEYLAYFLLGYFFLSNEDLLKKLDQYRFWLFGLFVLYAGFMMFVLDGEFYEMACWLSILAFLGLARHYLNFSNKATAYLSKSSFGVYLFHQSWIVIVGYFVLKITSISILQILMILLLSILLTFLTYEGSRRVPVLRWMFGLKK